MPDEAASTRTTTWRLTTADQRDQWDEWSMRIRAARHPVLARVLDTVRDEDRGSLTILDPGSESLEAWARRTSASLPERVAILRAAAAALDALHAGTSNAGGVAHGGLTSDAIRVTPDGATRLVGYSPWAGADPDSLRFLAPELDPGSPATREGDIFAFARIVAEVAGGSAVIGATDVAEVVRALRTSPETRRRTRLVKVIHGALTSPPDARPHPLTPWLTTAIEGTAATEVTGIGAVELEPSEPDPPSVRRHVSWPVAIGVVALAAAIAGWALHGRGNPQTPQTPPSRASTDARPFTATAAWAPPCGADSGIASDSTPEVLSRPTTADRLDREPAEIRVGRWHSGRLLLQLVGRSDDPVMVVGIGRKRVSGPGAPAWVVQLQSCDDASTSSADLSYHLDLDHDTMRVVEHGPRVSGSGAFALGRTPVTVSVDATACTGSFGWQPVVRYLVGSKVRQMPIATTFYTYGSAGAANLYTLGPGTSRPRVTPDPVPTGSGCNGAD